MSTSYRYKMHTVYISLLNQTASSLINKMMEDGILEEYTGYQRNRVFIF